MKQAPRNKAAILGTAVGAVIIGSSILLSCQPGELPCEDDEWQELCNSGGSSGNTGGGGGPGGMGGTGGGMAGMGGSGGAVTRDTIVPNCAEYSTVGAMDGFFEKRCGVNVLCHENAIPWTDLSQENLWEKLMDKSPASACAKDKAGQVLPDKLIDSGSWNKSVLFLKATMEPPACSDSGANAGTIMPPPPAVQASLPEDQRQDPLTADEKTCLENYLKAVTKQM